MAGEGLAIARVVRAFPGTTIERWAQWGAGWTDASGVGLAECITCGASTVQRNPDGKPDHFRHYQNDGKPVTT